jgi:hypothetical protein
MVHKVIFEVESEDYEWIRALCYRKNMGRRELILGALEIAFGKRKG